MNRHTTTALLVLAALGLSPMAWAEDQARDQLRTQEQLQTRDHQALQNKSGTGEQAREAAQVRQQNRKDAKSQDAKEVREEEQTRTEKRSQSGPGAGQHRSPMHSQGTRQGR